MSAPAKERTTGESITALLFELRRGNRDVEARLAPRVYAELRRAASRHMRRERANHTLQATALVNEAWLRLMERPNRSWGNRAHFFSVASRLMRQILVDHARRRLADKRGGAHQQAPPQRTTFFCGLSLDETAFILDVSTRTVKRDGAWRAPGCTMNSRRRHDGG